MAKEVLAYHTLDGREPFWEWFLDFQDVIVKQRISARIDRVEKGNYGNHKRFYGIIELRLDFGKGYRIYCGEDGENLVILLAGGDKSTQDKDILKALEYWRDYHEQKKI